MGWVVRAPGGAELREINWALSGLGGISPRKQAGKELERKVPLTAEMGGRQFERGDPGGRGKGFGGAKVGGDKTRELQAASLAFWIVPGEARTGEAQPGRAGPEVTSLGICPVASSSASGCQTRVERGSRPDPRASKTLPTIARSGRTD